MGSLVRRTGQRAWRLKRTYRLLHRKFYRTKSCLIIGKHTRSVRVCVVFERRASRFYLAGYIPGVREKINIHRSPTCNELIPRAYRIWFAFDLPRCLLIFYRRYSPISRRKVRGVRARVEKEKKKENILLDDVYA